MCMYTHATDHCSCNRQQTDAQYCGRNHRNVAQMQVYHHFSIDNNKIIKLALACIYKKYVLLNAVSVLLPHFKLCNILKQNVRQGVPYSLRPMRSPNNELRKSQTFKTVGIHAASSLYHAG